MDFSEAVEIYHKHHKTNEAGIVTDTQPSQLDSELVNGVWYLRNTNGLLAKVGTTKREVF